MSASIQEAAEKYAKIVRVPGLGLQGQPRYEADHPNLLSTREIKMNAFQAGADYALTSSNSEQQLLVEKLNMEVTRLKRIIAKELVEDDGLGTEFTYVCVLQEELAQAQAEVKRLHDKYDHQLLVKENDRFREALEYVAWPGMDRDHWDRMHKAQEALQQCFCKNGIRGRYCADYHVREK